MADRNQRQQERRRKAFRDSLAETDAEEIRARLADRRIRSAERIAIAEEVLREREQAPGDGDAGREATGPQPSARAMNGGDGGAKEEAARASAHDEGAPAAEPGKGSYARQIGHQIGRMVGMGLGVVGLAAVALLVLRR